MKILILILQIILALVFLGAGAMKLITPYAELIADPNLAWANDFSEMQIKIISLLEVLGALGLIIPLFIKKLKMFVPLSAIGLALTMVAATVTHYTRDESIVPTVALFVLSAIVAWFRRDFFKKSA